MIPEQLAKYRFPLTSAELPALLPSIVETLPLRLIAFSIKLQGQHPLFSREGPKFGGRTHVYSLYTVLPHGSFAWECDPLQGRVYGQHCRTKRRLAPSLIRPFVAHPRPAAQLVTVAGASFCCVCDTAADATSYIPRLCPSSTPDRQDA